MSHGAFILTRAKTMWISTSIIAAGLLIVTWVCTNAVLQGGSVPEGTPLTLTSTSFDLAIREAGSLKPKERRPWMLNPGTVALPLVGLNQQHSSWCWAASVQTVAGYYGRKYTQCELVQSSHWLGRLVRACPDIPGTTESIMAALEHAGIPARVIDRPLTELEMHAQIDGNRPVIVNLIATDAVLEGHVTVVRGYDALRDSLLIVDTVGSMPEIPGPAYTTVDKPLKYADLVRTTKSMSTGLFQVSEQLALISQAGPQYWSQTIIVAPPGETPTLNPKKIKPFLRWQQGYGSTIAD